MKYHEENILVIDNEPAMISTNTNNNIKKNNWKTKLSRKSLSCQKGFKKHIINFIKVMGTSEYFCQEDIEDYLIRIQK